MDQSEPANAEFDSSETRVSRRTLVKTAAFGLTASGLAGTTSEPAEAFVPNNFHALIHVTHPDSMPYAYSALQTIAEHYEKATGRLVIDGSAVTILTASDDLDRLEAASKAGSEIIVAHDALEINGIDSDSLPDFIQTDDTGLIAVVDAQVKGFHYYKL